MVPVGVSSWRRLSGKFCGRAWWSAEPNDKDDFEEEVICVFRLSRTHSAGFPVGVTLENCTEVFLSGERLDSQNGV